MIYVMSDLHGESTKFFNMLKKIEFNSEDTLVIAGDIIDRGSGGVDILKYVMNTPNVDLLLGNHEAMMIDAFKTEQFGLWFQNGGRRTYSVLLDELNIDKYFIESIIKYLMKCKLFQNKKVGDRKFLIFHAGISNKIISKIENNESLSESDKDQLLWDREWIKFNDVINDEYTFIFGHTPTPLIKNDNKMPFTIYKNKLENVVGIDCGAVFNGGQLACIRLNDMKIFYVN